MGAFGEKLRKQREQRGLALDAISNTTKISTRMLRALEDEHFDQLPGGVFNKGFVRAYARQVGLNEEEAVADYLVALRESQIQANSILPDFHDPHNRDLHKNDPHTSDLPKNPLPGNDRPADRGPQLLKDDRRKHGRRNEDRNNEDRNNQDGHNQDRHPSRHGSSNSTEGRQDESRRDEDPPDEARRDQGRGHRDHRDHRDRDRDRLSLPDSATRAPRPHPAASRFRQEYPAGSPRQPAPGNGSSPQIPWGKLAVALLLVTLALALWNSRRHRELAAAPQPASTSTQSPAPAPVPPSRATHTPRSTALKAGKVQPAATLLSGKLSSGTISAATTPSTATSASINVPAMPALFTVLIRAEETSWVSITADGKPVAHETLIAPAHTSVRASGEVVVKAGNAAGISFQLNGKNIPAQGNEGEVKTYVFDPTGIRVLPQTQAPTQAPATDR